MKPFFLSLTLGAMFCALLTGIAPSSRAAIAVSQNKNSSFFYTNSKEVIIQVADADEKSLPLIRSNIEQSGGMTFKGYCHEMKVLMYVMDTDVHPDLSFLNVAFVNVAMGYLIKEGSILQVQTACEMPSYIDPNAAQD